MKYLLKHHKRISPNSLITIEVSLEKALLAFKEALESVSKKESGNKNIRSLTNRFQLLLSNVDWDQDKNVMTTRIAF